MRNIPASRSAIFFLTFAVLLVSSCHKQAAQAPAPPTPVAAAPPAAPTITLQASPNTITRGGSSTLTWSSSNANQVRLNPGGRDVARQGSQSVSPNDSTVYTITATGAGGQATATTRIAVNVPPAPVAAAPPERTFEFTDAFYDYDKADIRTDAKQALQADADYLRSHPAVRFVIEGHCDERGGEEYNLALGDRRAEAAKDYLVSLGISGDRITTQSLGKEKPFCSAENESCYQQNRRGHFDVAAR